MDCYDLNRKNEISNRVFWLMPKCEKVLREILLGYTYPGVREEIVKLLAEIEAIKDMVHG